MRKKLLLAVIGLISVFSAVMAFRTEKKFGGNYVCYTRAAVGAFRYPQRYQTTPSLAAHFTLICTVCNLNPADAVLRTVTINA